MKWFDQVVKMEQVRLTRGCINQGWMDVVGNFPGKDVERFQDIEAQAFIRYV